VPEGGFVIAQIGVLVTFFAAATFSNTFTTGSAIVAVLAVVLFGIFTFRDKRTAGWKDLYALEREKNENLMTERENERVLRHSIKDELAATKLLLEVERNKPDLSVVLDQQRVLWTDATRNLTTLITGLVATQKAMQETQVEMLTILLETRTQLKET
jgi:hypothetical protein